MTSSTACSAVMPTGSTFVARLRDIKRERIAAFRLAARADL